MEGKRKQRVVLFPFMASGHITPFLLLAELILKHHPHCTITLVNTPLNIRSLRSSLPPDSKINLKSLPFNASSHGLPPDGENTNAIPFHLIINLLRASETLQPSFDRLIADMTQEDGVPPLCIVADNFLAWTVDVARKHGALHAIFFTGGAYGTAIFYSLWWHLPHMHTTANEFPLPDFQHIHLHRTQLTVTLVEADGTRVMWSDFLGPQDEFCKNSDALLINSVEEFERQGLSMLRSMFRSPVWPVGPLLQASAAPSTDISSISWLDWQPTASALYVSFGSQNTIRASQMMELALALEASRRPFIWVIRPPVGFDMRGEFKPEWLPEGFESRMRETKQGFMVHRWAPQVEILSHPSTGAFLSHCGWNSMLESLTHGVPIVGWPLAAEQFSNSKFLEEEVGVCVEVARGNRDSSKVSKEELERGIEAVMGNEEMRRKAKEVAEVLKAALKEDGIGNMTQDESVTGIEINVSTQRKNTIGIHRFN